MSRIEYLKEITKDFDRYYEDNQEDNSSMSDYEYRSTQKRLRYTIIALINALPPEDAVNFFDLTFNNNAKIRERTAKKIAKDIAINKNEYHDKFIDDLFIILETKGIDYRGSCAYAIGLITEHLPNKEKKKVINRLLSSKYAEARKRAYKLIDPKDINHYEKIIKTLFSKYKENELVWFIINNLSDNYVYEHFEELFELCKDYQYVKLFLKATKVDPKLVYRLKVINEISYCYVIAKNKLYITDNELSELLLNNTKSKDFGLLIWSLGELGNWNQLKKLFDNKYIYYTNPITIEKEIMCELRVLSEN